MKIFIKKIVSIGIVMVLSHCVVFGAIVSDDDGFSFVTKAEFDAIKNNFASQIDEYNLSINGKIEGAIASYLDGIKVSQEPTDEWKRVTEVLGGNTLKFKNKFKTVSSLNINSEVNVATTRDLCVKGEWGIHLGTKLYWQLHSGYDPSTSNRPADLGIIYAIFGTNGVDSNFQQRLARWLIMQNPVDGNTPYRLLYTDVAYSTPTNNWTSAVNACVFTKKKDIQASQTDVASGSGQSWIYHKTPAGVYYLRQYAESIWPVMNITVWRHDYLDRSFTKYTPESTFADWYLTDNGMNLGTTTLTLDIPSKSEYGSWSNGTKRTGDSETSETYYTEDIVQLKVNDGIDYSIYQYGKDFTNKLGCISDISKPTAKATKEPINVQNMTWNSVYYWQQGEAVQTNKFNDMQVNYYPLTQTLEEIEPNKFANEYVSGIAGEVVYLGGGAPIVTTYEEGNLKLQLKFASYKPDGTVASSDTIKYSISDSQFVKGDFATGSTRIVDNKSISVGTTDTINYYTDKKVTLWINMYSNTVENEATLSTFTIN